MRYGFFITARLKSTRLKRKILKDLNGKCVLERIIDRCKTIHGLDEIIVCTSTNPQDDELIEIAESSGVSYFRGDEIDVLKRLHGAANEFGIDSFLSITADNPLFCIDTSQRLLDWQKERGFDFVFTKGLPMGCATYMVNNQALSWVMKIKKESNTEIWGPFVSRSDFFNIGEVHVLDSPFNDSYRLTLDYDEDYLLLSKIYQHTSPENVLRLKDLFRDFDTDLWSINANREQIMPTDEQIHQINSVFDEWLVENVEVYRKGGLTTVDFKLL